MSSNHAPQARPLTQQNLDHLVCPVCHAPLQLQSGLESAHVLCTGCGLRYPIVDGLPVLLADRAL